MTELGLLATTLIPAIVVLCRGVLTLCTRVVLRASIERIAATANGRVLILGSTAEGATLMVEVQPTVAVEPSVSATKACVG